MLVEDVKSRDEVINLAKRIMTKMRQPAHSRWTDHRHDGQHRHHFWDRWQYAANNCFATPTSRCTSRNRRARTVSTSSRTRCTRSSSTPRTRSGPQASGGLEPSSSSTTNQSSTSTGEDRGFRSIGSLEHPSKGSCSRSSSSLSPRKSASSTRSTASSSRSMHPGDVVAGTRSRLGRGLLDQCEPLGARDRISGHHWHCRRLARLDTGFDPTCLDPRDHRERVDAKYRSRR